MAALAMMPFGTQSYLKFQHFTFWLKTGWRTSWSVILSLILITIIVEELCFCNTITVCIVIDLLGTVSTINNL